MMSTGHPRAFWLLFVCAIIGVFVATDNGVAQGRLVQLDTGAGQPLVTGMVDFSFAGGLVDPTLRMKVGFATDEVFQPGSLFDSFTITLQDIDGVITLVLATLDASGVVWAPPTPGTTPMGSENISRTAFDYPSLNPVLAYQQAFDMEVILPPEVAGRQFTAYFDLFDNQNGIPSQAFFQDVLVVPEPKTRWLMFFGGLGLLIFVRHSRENKGRQQLKSEKQ